MATRNIVPRATGEGSIGTAIKHWGAGYFDELPNWQEYLAESTGYGIVSGCEPSISGLTVTVGAGVYHTKEGTRVNIAEKTITVNAADATNPRYDVIYLDSNYVIQYQAGTAAVNPAYPSLPSGAEELYLVTVNAGVTKLEDGYIQKVGVKYSSNGAMHIYVPTGTEGDCTVFVTPQKKVIMIDCLVSSPVLLPAFLKRRGINRIDYFFLTHYHVDHFGSLPALMDSTEIDTSNCKWYLPRLDQLQDPEIPSDEKEIVLNYFTSRGLSYTLLNDDGAMEIEDNLKISWINCRDEDYNYYNGLTYQELGWYHTYNLYSVQFIIEYGTQRALIGGDGEYVVYSHLLDADRPQIKKCSLVKAGHHGMTDFDNSPSDLGAGAFVRKLSPDIVIIEGDRYGSTNSPEQAQHGLLQDFCKANSVPMYANKMGEIHICMSNNETTVIEGAKTAGEAGYYAYYITAYVDANNTKVTCDGSKENPFRSIQEALACCANNNGRARIQVAPGDYGSVFIRDCNIEIVIPEGYVTITGDMNISNSTITTTGNGTLEITRKLNITHSNLQIARLKIKVTDKIEHYILNTIMSVDYLTIDGTDGVASDSHFRITPWTSLLRITNLYASNETSSDALFAGRGGVIYISNVLQYSNMCPLFYAEGAQFNFIRNYVNNTPSFISTEVLQWANSELDCTITPYTRKRSGTTAGRPAYPAKNQLYFDTTLNTLIMYVNGNWRKTTDGTVV